MHMRIRKSPIQAGATGGQRAVQASILTAAALSLLSVGLTARAQTYSGSETLADFGTKLNQNNATYKDPNSGLAVAPNACVPTAVAQGLSYLDNYDPSAFAVNPNNVTAINALAQAMDTTQNANGSGGTSYPDRVTGTQNYLTASGDNAKVVGGQYASYYSDAAHIGPTSQSSMAANTTASFLAGALKANDGVEFALLWGNLTGNTYSQTSGGHFVTLQSISWNAGNNTGTISFIDPGSATYVQNATLTKIVGGNYSGDLYVTYPNPPVAAADGDNGELGEEPLTADWEDGAIGTRGGIIINDLAESVPDNALTAALLGGSLLGLLALRRCYC